MVGDKMRVCDLRQKEVINECSCKRLGCVVDIEFDVKTGCVLALIVPGAPKICGIFGIDTEYIIPFKCVKQIGEEIILVCVNEEEVVKKFC